MRTPILIPCLVLGFVSSAAADPPTLETQVAEVQSLETSARLVVNAHFRALEAGDTKALDKLWVRSATATSRSSAGETVTPIRRALRRWVAKRDGMSWRMGDIGVLTDGRVFVTARVTWNGGTYNDVLILEGSIEQPLHLVAKISTAVEESAHY
jgi:hypothetical protein